MLFSRRLGKEFASDRTKHTTHHQTSGLPLGQDFRVSSYPLLEFIDLRLLIVELFVELCSLCLEFSPELLDRCQQLQQGSKEELTAISLSGRE
jgi:hypothetical protein